MIALLTRHELVPIVNPLLPGVMFVVGFCGGLIVCYAIDKLFNKGTYHG